MNYLIFTLTPGNAGSPVKNPSLQLMVKQTAGHSSLILSYISTFIFLIVNRNLSYESFFLLIPAI